MDAINMAVLAELQEYAQLYFSAIVGLHTVDGRCGLKPGKYTAKELADSNKAACGLYVLPQDPMFDEQITITAGTFNCEFPYRRIFAILAQWEAMSKAGKQKAVFEIGEVEEKSAKVLLNEKTELGAFKTKSVKLQRIIGNWWMPRKVKKNQPIELYYELNGVMLVPGKQVWSDSPTDPQTVKWCEQHNDEEVSKLLLSFISNDREGTQQNTPYYAEVVNRANIAATPAEPPRISTETAGTVNVSAEDGNAEKTANFNDETRRYIIDTFKTKENLVAKFMDAIKSDNAELGEYKANTRKGGKFRKERMQHLEDSATELANQMEEWSAVFDEPLPIEEPHDHITIYQSALDQCKALAENPKVILREDVARVKRMDGKTARIVATNLDDGFSHCPLYFVVYVDEMPMLENYATLETAIESAKTDIPTNPFDVSQPPQSPETPQAAECIADTPKPQEMARKEPKQVIRNSRTTQRRTIKRFLIVQSVPRLAKCSTAHHIAGASKMAYSGIIPSGYAPPIRGDCKLSISTRAKPPNRASCEKINILQPP